MYPNLAYLFKNSHGGALETLFSKIQTFGFCLSVTYIVTGVLTLLAIKEKYKTFAATFPECTILICILFIASVVGSFIFAIVDMPENGISFSFNFLGSFLGCFVAAYWFCRLKKMDFLVILDQTAYPLCIGYAIGRLGCHLSGDGDWGIINIHMPSNYWIFPNSFWACDYPHNVSNKGRLLPDCIGQHCYVLEQPVYPTSLYEWWIGLSVGILLLYYKRPCDSKKGRLFSIFLVLMGIERFLMEYIKCNPKHYIIGYELSQAQIIAIGMFCAGMYLFKPSNFFDKT